MNLLESTYESFVIVDKLTADDGYGGVTTQWTDGARIMGRMRYDGSAEMKIAQAMGVSSSYTFTVNKSITLGYHTILRRERDAKYFRITSQSSDNETPAMATLDMRQYSAEEWELNQN